MRQRARIKVTGHINVIGVNSPFQHIHISQNLNIHLNFLKRILLMIVSSVFFALNNNPQRLINFKYADVIRMILLHVLHLDMT